MKLTCDTDQRLFNLAKFDYVLFPVYPFLCNFILQSAWEHFYFCLISQSIRTRVLFIWWSILRRSFLNYLNFLFYLDVSVNTVRATSPLMIGATGQLCKTYITVNVVNQLGVFCLCSHPVCLMTGSENTRLDSLFKETIRKNNREKCYLKLKNFGFTSPTRR